MLAGRALLELGPELSSLIVVSAHEGPAEAIAELRARGLPVRWLRVAEGQPMQARPGERDVTVAASAVDGGDLVTA